MGKNMVYLLKGIVFAAVLLAVFLVLLAGLMYGTGLSERLMRPLVVAAYAFAVFVGGLYFSGHGKKRRFLWGLLFGLLFFFCYLGLALGMQGYSGQKPSELALMFVFSLLSGMTGGMCR